MKLESEAGTVHVAPPAYVLVPSLQPANEYPVFVMLLEAGSVTLSPTTFPVNCAVLTEDVPPSSA